MRRKEIEILEVEEDYKSKKIEPIERKVEMEIEGVKYTFNLKRTENSYFIIYKNEARELKWEKSIKERNSI